MSLTFMFPPSLGPIAASARAELVGDWLGRRLGTDIDVTVASDYTALAEALALASIDIAWAPPGVCARVHGSPAAMYKAVRAGRASYRGAIVARAEITDPAQLVGRRAAWIDPLATSGYLLAIAWLSSVGIAPARLAGETFVGSYGAAVRELLSGAADFMSIYTPEADVASVRDNLRDLVGDRANALNVLAFTEESPNDGLVLAARPGWRTTQRAIETICDEHDRHVRPSLLHRVFDADSLVPARSADYTALRIALSA